MEPEIKLEDSRAESEPETKGTTNWEHEKEEVKIEDTVWVEVKKEAEAESELGMLINQSINSLSWFRFSCIF
jgi:hypothetical protein